MTTSTSGQIQSVYELEDWCVRYYESAMKTQDHSTDSDQLDLRHENSRLEALHHFEKHPKLKSFKPQLVTAARGNLEKRILEEHRRITDINIQQLACKPPETFLKEEEIHVTKKLESNVDQFVSKTASEQDQKSRLTEERLDGVKQQLEILKQANLERDNASNEMKAHHVDELIKENDKGNEKAEELEKGTNKELQTLAEAQKHKDSMLWRFYNYTKTIPHLLYCAYYCESPHADPNEAYHKRSPTKDDGITEPDSSKRQQPVLELRDSAFASSDEGSDVTPKVINLSQDNLHFKKSDETVFPNQVTVLHPKAEEVILSPGALLVQKLQPSIEKHEKIEPGVVHVRTEIRSYTSEDINMALAADHQRTSTFNFIDEKSGTENEEEVPIKDEIQKKKGTMAAEIVRNKVKNEKRRSLNDIVASMEMTASCSLDDKSFSLNDMQNDCNDTFSGKNISSNEDQQNLESIISKGDRLV